MGTVTLPWQHPDTDMGRMQSALHAAEQQRDEALRLCEYLQEQVLTHACQL